jgi:hypothetical protein
MVDFSLPIQLSLLHSIRRFQPIQPAGILSYENLVCLGLCRTSSSALSSPILLSTPILKAVSEGNSCGVWEIGVFACISIGIGFMGMKRPSCPVPKSDFGLSASASNNCALACVFDFLFLLKRNAAQAAANMNKTPNATPTPMPVFAPLLSLSEGAGILVDELVGMVVESWLRPKIVGVERASEFILNQELWVSKLPLSAALLGRRVK